MADMGKYLVAAVAALAAFWLANQWMSGGNGDAEALAGSPAGDRALCVRKFERMAPDPSKAGAVCDCMLAEFSSRGVAVTDALGPRMGEMREVVRGCAEQSGIVPAGG